MSLVSDDRLRELSDRFPSLDCEAAYLIRLLRDIRKIQDREAGVKSTISCVVIGGVDLLISLLLLVTVPNN